MMPNKKIIAFDQDDTLTETKTLITDEMTNLVKELTKKKMVAITSGASFEQFRIQLAPLFDEKFLSLSGDNLILLPTNASKRYQYDKTKKSWVMTYRKNFDPAIKEKACKLLQEMIDSNLYDITKTPTGEIIEDRDTQIGFSALGQKAGIEGKKIWDPDQKKRQKMKVVIESKIPEVTVEIGGTTTLDILPKGFTKGVGLKMLLDQLEFHKPDMIYVGDTLFPGGNDYTVLEAGIDTISVSGPEETANLIKNWLENL